MVKGRSRSLHLASLAGLGLALAPVVLAVNSGRVEYYHHDALGNVRVVTNETGQVLERHDYLPFGEECTVGACAAAGPSTETGLPRGFTGKERDKEPGLDYFGARYYASRVGRFISIDPYLNIPASLLEPQRWNRYAYVTNNPMRFTDPDGRDKIAEFFLGEPGRHVSTFEALAGTEAQAHYARTAAEHPLIAGQLGAALLFAPDPSDAALAPIAARGLRLLGKADDALDALRTTESGISVSRHAVNQKINRSVRTADELDAIKRPLEVKPVKIDDFGRPSQRSIGRSAEVVRNPETGQIVSVNPTSTSKAERLLRRNEQQ